MFVVEDMIRLCGQFLLYNFPICSHRYQVLKFVMYSGHYWSVHAMFEYPLKYMFSYLYFKIYVFMFLLFF